MHFLNTFHNFAIEIETGGAARVLANSGARNVIDVYMYVRKYGLFKLKKAKKIQKRYNVKKNIINIQNLQ